MASSTSRGTSSHAEFLCVGEFTRKLLKGYKKYKQLLDKDGVNIPAALSHALSDIGVGLVSDSFSQTLLKCLEKNIKSPVSKQELSSSSNGTIITWSEYCVIAAELFAQKEEPHSQLTDNKNITKQVYQFDQKSKIINNVFLGGSCNPTVWRKEECIPLLQKEGISYYNPQVDEWYPELMHIEEQAKEDASVILFVIDAQTRAISSMIETALLIGAGRRIVVVIKDIDIKSPINICGERINNREILDINRGRNFLRELADMHSVIIEPSVNDATKIVIDILKQKLSSEEVVKKCSPVVTKTVEMEQNVKEIIDRLKLLKQLLELCRANYDLLTDEVITQLQSFTTHSDCLYSSLSSVLLSCHSSADSHIHSPVSSPRSHTPLVSCCDPSVTSHSHTASNLFSSDSSYQSSKDQTYSDHSSDMFCVCYSELRHYNIQQRRCGFIESLYSLLWTPLQWMNEWVLKSNTPPVAMTTSCHSDVFLGGTCGNFQWRNDIAIPLLRNNNVSFFNPLIINWDPVSLPLERKVKDNCNILLYVITGETLSIWSLIEVAYYIGTGKQVVLCVQSVLVNKTGFASIEGGIELKETSIKDYNRGRSYLRSLSKKRGVPVYDNINDAVMCCICIMKGDSNLTRRGRKRPLNNSTIMTDDSSD